MVYIKEIHGLKYIDTPLVNEEENINKWNINIEIPEDLEPIKIKY